jgi:hypothetical protein
MYKTLIYVILVVTGLAAIIVMGILYSLVDTSKLPNDVRILHFKQSLRFIFYLFINLQLKSTR